MNDFDEERSRRPGWLHHLAEQAEAHVEKANRLIRAIGDAGRPARLTILGPAISQEDYSPESGRPDSSLFVHVVLDVPRGIGIVRWDMDVHYELSQTPGALERDAPGLFVPFAECPVDLRARCFPHLAGLLLELRKRAG